MRVCVWVVKRCRAAVVDIAVVFPAFERVRSSSVNIINVHTHTRVRIKWAITTRWWPPYMCSLTAGGTMIITHAENLYWSSIYPLCVQNSHPTRTHTCLCCMGKTIFRSLGVDIADNALSTLCGRQKEKECETAHTHAHILCGDNSWFMMRFLVAHGSQRIRCGLNVSDDGEIYSFFDVPYFIICFVSIAHVI